MTRIPARREVRASRLAPATAVVAAALVVAVASACGADTEDRAATVEDRAANVARDPAPDRQGPDSGPAGMCAAELTFRGTTYVMDGSRRLVDGVDGPVIGSATVPACDDTPGGDTTDGGTSPRVDVQRFPGSPAAESVVADGQVWIAYP